MACPTCNHTMQRISPDVMGMFWCPRCGTIRNHLGHTDFEAPKLVDRCREFGGTLGPAWISLWQRIGIEEAIYTPEERLNK